MAKKELTQEILRECVEYIPETGKLVNLVGKVLGYESGGYLVTRIHGIQRPYHHLVWIYHNGNTPNRNFIEFIDGDRLNTRIENLRLIPSKNEPLTLERLKQVLRYDEDSGDFFVNTMKENFGRRFGKKVGCLAKNGYIVISIDGKKHYAHRLAWMYVYGKFPDNQIDHIDRCKTNNAIANLRKAERYQNLQNIPLDASGVSGLLGATLHKQENGRIFYTAEIALKKNRKYLGSFTTAEQAHEAYLAAKRKFHEFNTL
jgi:hypothetical protein